MSKKRGTRDYLFEITAKTKKMTLEEQIENFKEGWDNAVNFNGLQGNPTRQRWEKILFKIWKTYYYKNKKLGGYPISTVLDGEKHNSVSRVINRSVEAGLLFIIKDYYHGKNRADSRPGVYEKNYKLFTEVFGEKFRNWQKETNEKNNKNEELSKSADDEVGEIDIGSLSNLDVKTALTAKPAKLEKLNYDIYKLYELKKTMLPHYFELMKKLNAAARDDGLKFTRFLKFDEEGLPSGRPWCKFYATMNDEKEHKEIDFRKSRKDYLNKIGLGDYIEVFDMKSQVPRVNYLFHTGEWKPNDYDFYKKILHATPAYKLFCEHGEGGIISMRQTGITDREDSMKGIFMRVFFGTKSAKGKFSDYDYELRNGESPLDKKKRCYLFNEEPVSRLDEAVKLKPKKIIYDDKLNIIGISEEEIETRREEIYEELGLRITKKDFIEIYLAEQEIVKPSIGKLIFWFTFILETEVRIELLKRGKEVYNVYDGFYYHRDFKKEIEAEIQEILKDKAKMVYENWMKPLHLSRAELAKRINYNYKLATQPDKKQGKKKRV